MKIAIADLTRHALEAEERLKLGTMPDDPDPTYFLSEASQEFSLFLREHGLYVEGDHVNYEPSQREEIERECNAVIEEYDNDRVVDGTVWEAYGLQGDDDVDYNGGYILTFLELVEDYLKNHPVT